MSFRSFFTACLLVGGAHGCTSEVGVDEFEVIAPEPTTNLNRDVLSTSLDVDLMAGHATAVISVAASTRTGASFQVGDLHIESVSGPQGPLRYRVENGQLDVGLRARAEAELRVEYRFARHSKLEGVLASGTSFTWPYFCGNVFPCKTEPADGLRFALNVHGAPAGKKLVYAPVIPADAPSYMLAWAVGDYTSIDLGTTPQGRKVSVHYLPGGEAAARKGTLKLVQVFDWLESTYGEYLFGTEVGSVSANWGSGAFGGMEHHPYWHVSSDSMGDAETHAHEAAHGWFGDGVRLACWEDLTLSEGTVSYLAARALEATAGKTAGTAVWKRYETELDAVIASEDRLALPATCNKIDVLTELWNSVPYMKGAFFYRAVEAKVGRSALDAAIGKFYRERKGKAARMQDMLDTIQAVTGFDPKPLADGWLRSLGRPDK